MAGIPGGASVSTTTSRSGRRLSASQALHVLGALGCLALVALGATHAPLTAVPELVGGSTGGGAGTGGIRLPSLVSLIVALALLTIAVVLRRRLRRGRDDEPPVPWMLPRVTEGRFAGVATLLVCVVVFLGAVWLLAHLQLTGSVPPVAGSGQAPGGQPVPAANVAGSGGVDGVLIAVSALLGLVLLLALTLLVRASRSSRGRVTPAARGRRLALQDAVASASADLRETVGGDRAAVIACYQSMESSLREAGIPRGEAGTATEQLARAAVDGLIDAKAGRSLVDVFHRARFSDHPVAATDRRVAERALARIEADLRSPR